MGNERVLAASVLEPDLDLFTADSEELGDLGLLVSIRVSHLVINSVENLQLIVRVAELSRIVDDLLSREIGRIAAGKRCGALGVILGLGVFSILIIVVLDRFVESRRLSSVHA